ncbi:hypothetical protein HPB51_015687 [Rhipicephalus microplus]|uniref:Uncharacterized protein n=1 Tax=Rhipicephalus microplus TaxID=6941 RepID=A0A9J6D5J2_RHIMP|nr:hypothetical protein HPB51_015687 [Rhipicephalus microplus]
MARKRSSAAQQKAVYCMRSDSPQISPFHLAPEWQLPHAKKRNIAHGTAGCSQQVRKTPSHLGGTTTNASTKDGNSHLPVSATERDPTPWPLSFPKLDVPSATPRKARDRLAQCYICKGSSLQVGAFSCDDNTAANSVKQLLLVPLKCEKTNSSSTAPNKIEGLSSVVSSVKRNDVLPQDRDTSETSKSRCMCCCLQSPTNNPRNEEVRLARNQLAHKPENLDPTPEKRYTRMNEQPHNISVNSSLWRSLGHSSESLTPLQRYPAGAPRQQNSIADAASGLSDKEGNLSAPSLPPTDDTKRAHPACGDPPSKACSCQQLRTRRLDTIATGPGGLLRHYASRVNDGSWRWHSKTETSTTATESSSDTHTTSGNAKSKWPFRATCLVLCLIVAALLSFVTFYAIADAVFTRRRSLVENVDPATIQPLGDEVA